MHDDMNDDPNDLVYLTGGNSAVAAGCAPNEPDPRCTQEMNS